jgi:hypothetical protein
MGDRPDALALVVHEIGGALTPARNALDIVRTGAAHMAAPEAQRFIELAARNLARAERILDNVTALAAPAAWTPRWQPVALAPLFARLCEEYAGDAVTRGIAVGWEVDPRLEIPTDARCLEQILVNLVSNALKFTPSGGAVTLRGERARGPVLPGRLSLLGGGFGVQPRLVCVEVADTGIGLSEDARHRLFEPFYRSDEARRFGAPGLGLGLTVARQLAQLVHADLRVGAHVGSQTGARLVLTVPADDPTRDLVSRLDTLLAELAPRWAEAAQSLVVLRLPAAAGAAAWPAVRVSLAATTADIVVAALSPTTWVVSARLGLRPLLAAVTAAVHAAGGDALVQAVRMHAQRTRRGGSADESLLQGLVRARHPLPERLGTRVGVSDVQDPAGR